jgi:uncharacterized protein (TIGR02600 family)
LGASQPTQGEYQRYPGHPATTNLSPALRWLFKPAGGAVANDFEFKEALFRLLPRLQGGEGSSMGGTRANDDQDLKTVDRRLPKRDRLFASLDEFWFRPDRSPISKTGFFGVFRKEGGALSPDWDTVDTQRPELTPQVLEQLRFFLTAHSRSPDLNAFGMPRVSIWPVHEVDNKNPLLSKRSGYDDLMAFCSSVSKKSYYFTRLDPWSTQDDLVSGTKAVDPLPSQPLRNQHLLFAMTPAAQQGYLQRMGKKTIPGVGGSLAGKYSAPDPTGQFTEYERILLTMFDYIRTVNLIDTGRKDLSPSALDAYKLAYTPGYSDVVNPVTRYERNTKATVGSGQVIPSVVYAGVNRPVLKGFGRFVNLSEIGLVFYRDDSGALLPGDDPIPPYFATDNWRAGIHYMGIRCVMVPEMWTVSPGYTALSEGYAYRVKELQPFIAHDPNNTTFANKELNIALNDFCMVNVNPWRLNDGRFFMPTRGFNNHFVYETPSAVRQKKTLRKPNNVGDASSYPFYPFYSKRFYVGQAPTNPTNPTNPGPPVRPLSKEFNLDGGEFEFEFYPLQIAPGTSTASNSPAFAARANLNQLIQRVRVEFPIMTLQVPEANSPNAAAPKFQDRIASDTYFGLANRDANTYYGNPQNWGMGLIRPTDVVRTMEFNSAEARGDYRVLAGLTDVPKKYFMPSGDGTEWTLPGRLQIHNFRNSWGRNWVNAEDGSGTRWDRLTPNASIRSQPAQPGPTNVANKYVDANPQPEKLNKVPARKHGSLPAGAVVVDGTPDGAIGDFDRGIGKNTDGAFINKPDEGNVRFKLPVETDGGHLPYFRGGNGYEETGQTYFSPNRLIPSAVMFGSLPNALFGGTGLVNSDPKPWQTLLFCPPTISQHLGAQSPADHYFLDLFHMPVVEPYAISEPLSTAGKVNINSRLAPFGYVKVDGRSYIQRHTGWYGVVKGMKQFLIDPLVSNAGHAEGPLNNRTAKTRFDIKPDIMMEKVVDPYLDSKKYFKYASEICELDLPVDEAGMPANTDASKRTALFDRFHMTGDNARERPYAHIYPRITTKSNVYTVHVWAQSIAKNAATKKDDWDSFDETKDRVLGEYRGSSTIERYIDSDEEALRDYDAVDNTNARGLDPYYRFRIINQKRFTPQ